MALRQMLELGCGALVLPEQIAVREAASAFDDDGQAARRARRQDICDTVLERLVESPGNSPTAVRRTFMDPRDRLIVALDLPSVAAAEAMVERLGESVTFYKIGYQLAFARAGSISPNRSPRPASRVFLDLKLHDIGNTVARGVENVARMGANFLTVHAYPQTMQAAVEARGDSGLRILAVTVLTSYDDADLAAAGYDFTVPELVAERAAQARDIGIDGLVCSAEEAVDLRTVVGLGHGAGDARHPPARARRSGDQKRVMTPAAAITAGADYLVVGRPILDATDPKAAAETIVAEIASAVERSNRRTTWRRATGSPASTVNDQAGYDEYRRRNAVALRQVRRQVHRPRRRPRACSARRASTMSCSNFRPTRRRSPASSSPEYKDATQYLKKSCDVDLVIAEGYEGAQP